MLLAQPVPNDAVGPRPLRLFTRDGFVARLAHECGLGQTAEGLAPPSTFAVAHLDLHPATAQAARRLEDTLAQKVGRQDAVACLRPGTYVLLLGGTARVEAEGLLGRLAAELVAKGSGLRVGIAVYPDDGGSAEGLLAAAARACGGDRDAPRTSGVGDGVIVADPVMVQLYRTLERIAAGTISVLILGETGAGKEITAEAIHRRSPRREKPFLRLNCAALSQSLLESELFGYEKGAFTGATQAKPGLLETAHGGTVFLDEIGELPASLQVKLLRVLEDRQVLRVGSLKPRAIDVRFIAATNRNLEAEIARGTFREDLFFRLNGVTVTVPPLRDRPSEIERLARHFIAIAAAQLGREPPGLSADALDRLRHHLWPGNVRELRNVMERAVLLAGEVITVEHLPIPKAPEPARAVGDEGPVAPTKATDTTDRTDALKRQLGELEKQRIVDALARCAGNQRKAAALLGISRGTLLARLEAYGLPRPRKRPTDDER
jgi:DNA-binding NtrC family response regulator